MEMNVKDPIQTQRTVMTITKAPFSLLLSQSLPKSRSQTLAPSPDAAEKQAPISTSRVPGFLLGKQILARSSPPSQ